MYFSPHEVAFLSLHVHYNRYAMSSMCYYRSILEPLLYTLNHNSAVIKWSCLNCRSPMVECNHCKEVKLLKNSENSRQ
uniref:RanBP2-type domain-containing protein n=1 Tax=Angiostrongylus cantonensis TaxID=6313 RepID=A0A0K0DHJ3_ANGCA